MQAIALFLNNWLLFFFLFRLFFEEFSSDAGVLQRFLFSQFITGISNYALRLTENARIRFFRRISGSLKFFSTQEIKRVWHFFRRGERRIFS
jgi:hypothetical protein